MRASTSASQAWGSTSLSLAVWISVSMTAARSPPRSDPANSPKGNPAQPPLGRVVAQADAAVVEEAREDLDALEHVIHRLGHFVVARELAPLPFHPINEI